MKFSAAMVSLAAVALASAEDAPESPVKKVLVFIKDLQKEVQADKDKEEASYKKYADWCETTISDAQKDIENAKAVVEEQTAIIEKMSGKGGASAAEIDYLKKTIVKNGESKAEADTIRAKEKKKYEEVKEDLDSGIEAMKGMMTSLSSPDNAPAASFLSVDAQQASARKVLSNVLKMPALTAKFTTKDLQSLRSFVQGDINMMQVEVGEEPDSNLGGVTSVIQTTLEDYEGDLEDANKEEAEKVADYEKLVKSLQDEIASMEATLAEQTASNGDAAKTLADAKMLREDTEVEMKADKKLLVETQDGCKVKKDQYETRTKLRTEELAGIDKALEILGSDKATKTFDDAAKVKGDKSALIQEDQEEDSAQEEESNEEESFVQVSSDSERPQQQKALVAVQALAQRFHSLELAQLAIGIKGGHFDKVIDAIDKQIKALRDEMDEDVRHKDRCEEQLSNNGKLITELTHTSEKAQTKIDRLTEERNEVQKEYDTLLKEMDKTQADIKEREEVRTEEREQHLTALKHDTESLEIIGEAIEALTAFYKKNKIDKAEATLAQKPKKEAGKPKTAEPDAGFSDTAYKGNQQATNGVLSMMGMVKDNMEEEIKKSKDDDAKDQDQYEADYKALKGKFDSQEAAKVTTEKSLAGLQEKLSQHGDFKAETDADLTAANEDKTSLENDCAWVKKNFQSRREKRQAEIDGLTEAKGLLGVGGVR
eukprot:TRINITY_DN3490_c0_g1_i1.p1 TRINITY_DN3490_c0_g1~~TRINITY_DN3490_c0_g1_i1.p1  ORF type:complete len:712 (+),score=284.37 TRINITY_DN3490_c0_g1_i1:110-2245(+)